jgi:hypothetical protein
MRLFEGELVQSFLPGARLVAGFLLTGLLAGCGSSGGDEATQTVISTNAITFSSSGPDTDPPAAQTFTATFGEDIAHLAVVHSGDAIASATSVMSGRSAQITVVPAAPRTLGSGPFVGAVAVTGYTCADATCSRLTAGSTATVSVNYQISPAVLYVAPYVATTGVADTVVVTGEGFRSFNVSGVRFNDTAATAIAVDTSGREIVANQPALAAGAYTVNLDAANHQGPVPSNVTLLVRDPPAFAAATLPHLPATTAVRSLSYDAERQALLLVTDTAPSGSIVRYAYENGAWGAPAQAAASFVDAELSINGRQLFGLTATTVVPVDPVTLALGTAVTAPDMIENSTLKNIVVGNNNVALITTTHATSGLTPAYLYDPVSAAMVRHPTALYNGTPAMAANGSGAIVVQGDATLTSELAVYLYATSSSALNAGTVAILQNSVPPVIDRSITRVVLNGRRVYDGALAFLGTLPETTTAIVLKPNGSRAYTYDPTAGGILTYDISVDRDEAAYTALGAATPLAGDPGSGVRMTISPDGGTLFLAGSTQIVVQPAPAL